MANELKASEAVCPLMEQFRRKNHDYGNSAHLSYVQFGDVAYLARIGDKLNRFGRLKEQDRLVMNETSQDTVGDLYTYLCMWLAEDEDGEMDAVLRHMEELAAEADKLDMVKTYGASGMDRVMRDFASFGKDTSPVRLGTWAMYAALVSIAAYTALQKEPF